MILRKYPVRVVLVLLTIFAILAVWSVWGKSPTYDEPNWMTIAWYLTHTWSWQADYHVLMHPPLSFYLHGLPLRIMEIWHRYSHETASPSPEGQLAERFPYPYSAFLKYDAVFIVAKILALNPYSWYKTREEEGETPVLS